MNDMDRLTGLTGSDENRRKVEADNRGSCLPPFPSDIIYLDAHLSHVPPVHEGIWRDQGRTQGTVASPSGLTMTR